jgi:nitrogen-specific signal transduction histidine kinase
MAQSIYKRKGNFKGFLFVLGLIIIGGILIYTQHLVNLLQKKSTEYLRFRIRVFEENINNPNTDMDLSFFFTEVIQGTDYPIIYTDSEFEPQLCQNIDPTIDTLRTFPPSALEELRNMVQDMDEENQPISIEYQGITLGYYHYGVSPVIKKLRWLPYIEIAAALLFIFIGYIGFSQIKKSEQRHIWVGMAKETAHQLGTPISSLNGWIEILKDNPDQRQRAVTEMATDAHRLNKIASRFSQIGSVPSLKKTNLIEIMRNTVNYFQKRLPQLKKRIIIKEVYPNNVFVMLNSELFEWVVENLIRNAIDAVENKEGLISVSTTSSEDSQEVYIDISDNGKGISPRDKRNIFRPGFSTKSRGWGLGLSLAKRIIEDYHGGKLYLKDTRIGSGTTMRIVLSKARLDNNKHII